MYYYPNNAAAGYMQPQSQGMASQMPQLGLKGRPVSSLEEVRAAQIDFDGSLFLFPDLAHNRIYTKQISLDGTASLNVYELSQLPTTSNNVDAGNYVTRTEFEDAVAQIKEAFNQVKDPKAALPQFNF